ERDHRDAAPHERPRATARFSGRAADRPGPDEQTPLLVVEPCPVPLAPSHRSRDRNRQKAAASLGRATGLELLVGEEAGADSERRAERQRKEDTQDVQSPDVAEAMLRFRPDVVVPV